MQKSDLFFSFNCCVLTAGLGQRCPDVHTLTPSCLLNTLPSWWVFKINLKLMSRRHLGLRYSSAARRLKRFCCLHLFIYYPAWNSWGQWCSRRYDPILLCWIACLMATDSLALGIAIPSPVCSYAGFVHFSLPIKLCHTLSFLLPLAHGPFFPSTPHLHRNPLKLIPFPNVPSKTLRSEAGKKINK